MQKVELAGPGGRGLGYKYLSFKYQLPNRMFIHGAIMNSEPCNGPKNAKHSPVMMLFQGVGNNEQHVFDED